MTGSDVQEVVILCEGYDDRAFLSGALLAAFGFTNLAEKRRPVRDRRGREVKRGQYLFESRSARQVRIVPCSGVDPLLAEGERRIDQRQNELFDRLVMVVDDDSDGGTSGRNRARLEGLLRKWGGQDARLELTLSDPSAIVSGVLWSCDDQDRPGIPAKQTLERIVCAAICATAPDKAESVQKWLDGRPSPVVTAQHKSSAWSYMAGWFPDHGCEHFFRALWDDATTKKELESRLRSTGLWQILDALVV